MAGFMAAAFLLRAKGFEEKSLKSRARGKTNDNFGFNFACPLGTVVQRVAAAERDG